VEGSRKPAFGSFNLSISQEDDASMEMWWQIDQFPERKFQEFDVVGRL